ncbi:hypothetical protein GCM10009836_44080 [Pseudonocardia ailaonensis]|uniref:EthD domain-containing protein n=1 Tax=Pseudonocardia ailaonensis TaxID=367279 RepID=A0ABN2NBY5_9PSEU
MIKTIALVRRRVDLTHGEFRDYYENHHAKLISEVPHVARYVRRYIEPSGLWNGPGAFDAITEIWFSSQADYDAAMARLVELQELFATDAANVFDTSATQRFVVLDECDTDVPGASEA